MKNFWTLLVIGITLMCFAACSSDDDDDVAEDTVSASTSTSVETGVDMGLSVMWANCNVGASSPEEAGYYYAWGMTETLSSYSSSTCTTYQIEIDDFSGDATYDVARAVMGGSWRLPTVDEMDELIEECEWIYTSVDSIPGYKVTGPSGNSIFLPICGYYNNSIHMSPDSHGAYWTSTPYPSSTLKYAWNLALYNSSRYLTEDALRYHGHTIRAVKD